MFFRARPQHEPRENWNLARFLSHSQLPGAHLSHLVICTLAYSLPRSTRHSSHLEQIRLAQNPKTILVRKVVVSTRVKTSSTIAGPRLGSIHRVLYGQDTVVDCFHALY